MVTSEIFFPRLAIPQFPIETNSFTLSGLTPASYHYVDEGEQLLSRSSPVVLTNGSIIGRRGPRQSALHVGITNDWLPLISSRESNAEPEPLVYLPKEVIQSCASSYEVSLPDYSGPAWIMGFAGTPTTVLLGCTSLITTAPAHTVTCSPMLL